jgi:CDP-4-dehydro-6-deoxyglucose reductase
LPKVTLQPSGLVLQVERGERILDAARRQGFECPQSCRNGNCQICAALLVNGRIQQSGQPFEEGEIYSCLAVPEQDCVLHWEGVLVPGELPLRHLTCQLIACEAIGGDVYRVQLRAPAGKPPRYHAGQYLLIEREDGDMAAFSIASAPYQGRELELHILAREASSCSLLEQLQRTGVARLQMPLGDTHLAGLQEAPLLLIAAGTGMAQMHSLLEHCRHKQMRQPIHLYWGVRSPEDFYHIEHWADWQQMANVQLHRVVSDQCGWDGRCGLLHQAIEEDFADLSGLQVFASGSPAMVYATLDALVEAGMHAGQMRADVFAYAPR